MHPLPRASRALRSRVVPAFQPIVDLADRRVVGYEALARWPEVPEARPDEVFAAAAAQGHLADLDWLCRRAAVETALRGGLRRPLTLFVNVEPRALGVWPSWEFPYEKFRDIASTELQIILEFTERELLADPGAVMTAIDWARSQGCGIAIDDVGVNPESLIMLPMALPDVVKLDRDVVVDPMTRRNGETVSFVADYLVSTGARVIAEGIETDRDVHLATIASATLGQGYLFGRPGPLPTDPMATATATPLRLFRGLPDPITRPSDVLDRVPTQVDCYATIVGVVDELGAAGTSMTLPGMMLISAPDAGAFARRFGDRYSHFASNHTLVGVIGADDVTGPGVRGPARPDLGFDGEFAVVIQNDGYTATIVAKDLGDPGPLENRRYTWCFTHDRAVVREVASCILRTLAPRHTPAGMAR